MDRHPSDEALLGFCEAPETPAAERVRRHIGTGCDRCGTRIAALREILTALRTSPLAPAPEVLVAKALATIRGLPRGAKPKTTLGTIQEKVRQVLEEVRLGLVLDTAAGVPMVGIRGAVVSGSRQMLFESAAASLHLQVLAGSGGCSITGQLVPVDRGAELLTGTVLVEGEWGSARGWLSPEGEFHLGGIPAGQARVRIDWDGRALITDPVALEQVSANG